MNIIVSDTTTLIMLERLDALSMLCSLFSHSNAPTLERLTINKQLFTIDAIMKINSFKFDDHKENWHLQETCFENFNLLVGVSGVGKTKILHALELACDVATDQDYSLDGIEWQIKFTHLEQEYEWELKSALSDNEKTLFRQQQQTAEILYEKITRIENNKPIELFNRSENGDFSLLGNKHSKPKKTKSAINWLSEQDDISIVYKAFQKFIFREISQNISVSMSNDPEEITVAQEDTLQTFFENISINTPTVFKGYILQNFFKDDFDEIKDYYLEIFPQVNDIRIDVKADKSGSGYVFSFAIREKASDNWILQPHISSGMFRTLVHLIVVSTVPTDSVIVIDEFENSLGINCMPELTDFILDKANERQFIVTSHHPYIIHNIPWEKWQIVSRHDHNVKVTKATEIPALDTASSLDKFTQLVNLPEYEGGIT